MRRETPLLSNPNDAWAPYVPSEREPWDLPRVAHLHRRAGFAAPWSTLERDLKDGPEPSIGRLLDGEPTASDGSTAAEFARAMSSMMRGPGVAGGLAGLQATWLFRMIFAPDPLRERMTLFWHDHFATSFSKVNDAELMRKQYELLRSHALGSFERLLLAIGRDPAMLIWLDATANKKSRPNENYAREVMELFTLGRGHYTEADIQQAARAFTGTFVVQGAYRGVPREHDAGDKTVLGQTGPFDGADIARLLLAQPSCAEYLSRKLFRAFVSEVDEPSDELIAPLAGAYRSSGYDTSVPVALILRSRLFHDPAMRRRRVKSPVEFAVGTIRSLEVLSPTVPAAQLAEGCTLMGQALFAPPSVAGWDGGTAWINTTTTLARSNAMLGLVGDARRFDAGSLASRHGASAEPDRFFVELLLQDALAPDVRRRIKGDAAEVARLVLTAPEYNLA